MFAWQATVQDERGNAVPSPVVTVYESDGATLASIFAEDGEALGNPLTGSIEGFVQFWAEPGRYKIVGANGGQTQEWEIEGGLIEATEFQTVRPGLKRPVIRRARDSVSALDLMSAGGLDEAVRNREATTADAAVITAAVQEVVTDCALHQWRVEVPAGLFWLDHTIEALAPVDVIGAGMERSIFRWSDSASSVGVSFSAGGIPRQSSIADMSVITDKINSGIGVSFDYSSLIGGGGNINPRALASAKVRNCKISGSADFNQNGFSKGVSVESGIFIDIRENLIKLCHAGAASATPVSTHGIHLFGDGQPVQALITANMVYAARVGLEINDYEGIYAADNEFVLVGTGLKIDNAKVESALVFAGNHIAFMEFGIDISKMEDVSLANNMLYTRDASAETGAFIVLRDGSSKVDVSGNVARRWIGPTMDGIQILGGSHINVGHNTWFLRNQKVGERAVRVGASASSVTVARQSYPHSTGAMQQISNSSASAQFEDFPAYSANVDNIVISHKMAAQVHSLTSAASGLPAGFSTVGAIIRTYSTTYNDGYQVLTNETGTIYRRKYSSGLFSAWVADSSRGSNADGTWFRFANGMQTCTFTVGLTSTTDPTAWSFPMPFSSTPSVSVSPQGASARTFTTHSRTTTGMTFSIFDLSGSRVAATALLTATGRYD